MFDMHAKELLELIPRLPELDHKMCRRYLSKAYYLVMRSRFQSVDYTNGNDSFDDYIEKDITELEEFFMSDEEDVEIDKAKIEIEEVKFFLKRLTDTLETIAIFDKLNGVEVASEVQSACAFVAAESLSLHIELNNGFREENDPFLRGENYVSIEAALLYMIGGYDINALSVVTSLNTEYLRANEGDPLEEKKLKIASELTKSLLNLCKGEVPDYDLDENDKLETQKNAEYTTYEGLLNELRTEFYTRVNGAIRTYLKWLGGYPNASLEEALQSLNLIREISISRDYKGYTEFSDIYHMVSLLIATIEATKTRSTVHTMPLPSEGITSNYIDDFNRYLRYRARGSNNGRGRPFLWPSAVKYAQDCLPGPMKDCVVAMPTGSGKSFVAELAVVHALAHGWVLYLAPTNALAYQIRRDLADALVPFNDIQVRAFVGGEEYSTLDSLNLDENNNFYVAVMTPEKCALALRTNPDVFSNCSLCVFDECHLLNDAKRGIIADIILAQLFNSSENIKFLLMSAMISNPQELADWLEKAHNGSSISEPIKWRPTRTLRGLIFLDRKELLSSFRVAKEETKDLPKKKKNVFFQTPLAAIFGLSGPWTMDGSSDYINTNLPIDMEVVASKTEPGPVIESWKNTASRRVSELFAKSGVSVINFILSSRHHAFSSANKVIEHIPESISNRIDFPEKIRALLSVADAELGIETAMWELLEKGIAVHTSAMLQVEQEASEWMFVHQKAKLMFATGTLAQGLNLPSIAVVISGTSLGGGREEIDMVDGISRVNSIILNGFGRAGRPGFSNQGIALLVSDRPYIGNVGEDFFPRRALLEYQVLGESDASVEVHSPIESFLDNILSGYVSPETATVSELELTSLLAETDANKEGGQILNRTFGAYKKREILKEEDLERARGHIIQIKEEFFEQSGVPDWLNTAAIKAGVDYFQCFRMWEAYTKRGLIPQSDAKNYTILNWLDVFMEVMANLPPKRIKKYLPEDAIKTETILTKIRDAVIQNRDIDVIEWDRPNNWGSLWAELKNVIQGFMNGETYIEIAKKLLPYSEGNINNGRSRGASPVPAIFKLIRTLFEPLAVDAGCFLALNQFGVYGLEANVPDELSLLPLCIRNGCESIGTISWFRYGIRQRKCAHALQQYFPVPPNLNEQERAKWIVQKRRVFIESTLPEGSILNNARTIILNGYAQ